MPITEGTTELTILTPLAAGAIAVVQLTGPGAITIADALFRPDRRTISLHELPPGQITYGRFLDDTGQSFDDGLALRGTADQQPWVEFNLHGGLRIVERLIDRAEALGAVHIPNTKHDRAFAWLPPLQRWMQQCLAHAATHRVVAWLAGQPALWNEQISQWLTQLDTGDVASVLHDMETLLTESNTTGQTWRGRTVAILGPPNAGKSTLANRLTGRDASLVDQHPGTTRDWVGQPAALCGWPVTLIDTAGLRESNDFAETQGVARALQQGRVADIRLLVLDVSTSTAAYEQSLVDQIDIKAYDVVVYNKIDTQLQRSGNSTTLSESTRKSVSVSAMTGQGITALEEEISTACGFRALQEQKVLVFCAELHTRLMDVQSCLQSKQISGARALLKSL